MTSAASGKGYDFTQCVIALNRVLLGLYLLLAGYSKISGGIGQFYQTAFLGLKPAWLPEWFASPYGHAVPVLELLVGLMLVVGFRGRIAAWLAALMIGSFTIALASAGKLSGPGPFHTNFLIITLALWLAVSGPGPLSIDRVWRGPRRVAS